MTANLTTDKGEVMAAYNVSRGHPWHRLGHNVTADMGLEEALKLSGSDDIVTPTTLYTLNDETGEYEEVEGSIGVKSDRYGVMSTPGPNYEITQRREMLELAYEIEGLDPNHEAVIDTIGNIGERAEKFFAYLRVKNIVIDPGGIADEIEHGLVVATSFNGTLPNLIGPSDIRVVCENTLEAATRGTSERWIKARHTRNSEERMKEAAHALGYIGAVEKRIIDKAEKMLKVDGDKALNRVLDEMWKLEDDMPVATRTRRENERWQIKASYDGPGNLAVDSVGRNGWAAYQAITEFLDHKRPVRSDIMGTRRAEGSVLPGKVMNDKAKASALILKG